MGSNQSEDAPLKPEHQLAGIVFSETGKVSKKEESLPRTQKTREASIVAKFASSLDHFLEMKISNLTPDEGQADFIGRLESDDVVLIQITRVIDQQMRRIREQRTSYLDRITAEYPELVKKFAGCRLSIIDAGKEPLLPPTDSEEGMSALSYLAKKLDEFADNIDSLELGKIRSQEYTIGPDNVKIGVLCQRGATQEEGIPAQLNWGGGYVLDPEHRNLLLARAIRQKIEKGYAISTDQFWLLVYSSGMIPFEDDKEVLEARSVLEASDHPFDQVWFLHPYPNENLGHLIQIWPPMARLTTR